MSDRTLVLLHSPLVGALTWRPVAEALRTRRRRVLVPSLSPVFTGPGPYRPAFAAAAAAAVRDHGADEAVLVGHSGAGTHLPEITAALEGAGTAVVGAIHVDASLPHPGRSWSESAPAELRDRVRAMAVDGVLPPWHEWFPAGTLEELLPDPDLLTRFRADVPSLPLSYLDEVAPPGPAPEPAAYLRLSPVYEPQAQEAERAGWPTTRLDTHHLAPLTEPGTVAAALVDLLEILEG